MGVEHPYIKSYTLYTWLQEGGRANDTNVFVIGTLVL